MNLLFFLTPKSEVEYIYDDFTLRQTLEKMEYHRFSEIPIISRDGSYLGTITEGDLLWFMKDQELFDLHDTENINIMEIKRKRKTAPVSISAGLSELIDKTMIQNFVPVVDDKNIFIGIVKRKDLIQYCYRKMEETVKPE